MHKLIIHKLGPIRHCELTCSQFMTFTGFQASGKSTIAKAIYYFRTIKNDIYSTLEDIALSLYSESDQNQNISKNKYLTDFLREKFLRVFGSSWGMDNDMSMEYYFSEDCFVKVYLKEENFYSTPNYVWIELCPAITSFLRDNSLRVDALGVPASERKRIQERLVQLFNDNYETVYIPAGRSMITLLSQQMSYIYTTMKDAQKRAIDYCTQDYIERILSLKSEFSDGLNGLAAYEGPKNNIPRSVTSLAMDLVQKVLRGSYRFADNEERIVLDNNKYVKINFASSGQQESVWILNLLFYYLVHGTPVNFIIEEPESHLFPESQKYITELITLIFNLGHSVLVTTHSPYVLGTLNNLLYADNIPKKLKDTASSIIPSEFWINGNQFSAWFVKNGSIEDCIDQEIHLIQNEKLDQISKVINRDFDKLFDLEMDE